MKWSDLLEFLGGAALFESSMLLSGEESPAEMRRQLSRLAASGRLLQLRRGLYAVSPPHARALPAPLAIASRLHRPSYVSLQSALAYHGAIPEAVPIVTSVTTGRPRKFRTPAGEFIYRHLHRNLFWGYEETGGAPGQPVYVALPEKAMLDLFHLTNHPIRRPFVEELRLLPDALDPGRLEQFARRSAKPKLLRAAALTAGLLEEARGKEQEL